MAELLCYTKQGTDHYRLLNDAVHFAVIEDGKANPMRNNTGVLFAKADLDDGTLRGCSKSLLYPWLFRFSDGRGGVIAVRRNDANQPDNKNLGCAIIYSTTDFVRFAEEGFLELEQKEVKNPRCVYDEEEGAYIVQWEINGVVRSGKSKDLKCVSDIKACVSIPDSEEKWAIPDAVYGNRITISDEECAYIKLMLDRVRNTDVVVSDVELAVGEVLAEEKLPKAECIYSDGSTHMKRVIWDEQDLKAVDTSKAGDYEVHGQVYLKTYPVPFVEYKSDPCVFEYNGKYYHTASGMAAQIRVSDTVDGLAHAEDIIIRQAENESYWAQELQIIKGIPYLFTSRCVGEWYNVQSVILKCNGEIENPEDWSEPIYCVRPDGRMLNQEEGICLDMTTFEVEGRQYVMWSDRKMDPDPVKKVVNEGGSNGPATICIAEIDPDKPWQLISDPVCVATPDYGWDRIETEVDEGPYLLRNGEDLWVTFSGASVGTVYCLGLLHAKVGADLLDPSSWEKIPYPLLTKESVPGQYGPGHNNFFKDPEGTGDDWICLLYRPAAEWHELLYPNEAFNPRHGANRRVHWNANGYPNLEMAPAFDLDPRKSKISITVHVK